MEMLGFTLITNIASNIITNVTQVLIQTKLRSKNKVKEEKEKVCKDINYFLDGLPQMIEMFEILDDKSCSFYNRNIKGIERLLYDYDMITNNNERSEFENILTLDRINDRITKCRQMLVRIKSNLD
jgi:hypothetical protein